MAYRVMRLLNDLEALKIIIGRLNMALCLRIYFALSLSLLVSIQYTSKQLIPILPNFVLPGKVYETSKFEREKTCQIKRI